MRSSSPAVPQRETHFIQQFFERSLSGRALRKVCGGKNRLYRRILTMPEFVTLNGTGRLGDAGLWVKDHLVPDRESSFDRDCVHRVLSGLGSDFVLRFYRTKADIRTNDSLKKAGIG